MPKYEFLVSNGMPVPATKSVRSHAIKTSLQLRSKKVAGEDSLDGETDSKRIVQCKKDLRGRFRLETAPKKDPKRNLGGKKLIKTHHPDFYEASDASTDCVFASDIYYQLPEIAQLGIHILDPFGTIPLQQNPRIDMLIKHFMVFFDYLTTTVPSNKTWLSLALQDPLLMRVSLSMTASFGASKTSLFSRHLRIEGLKLRGEAINQINSLLHDGQVSENLLAAIAFLGQAAVLDNAAEEADVHLQGLQGLIAERGGIESIKNYQVGRFINWVDLAVATARGRRPLFPLNYDLDRVKLPRHIIEASLHPSLSRLQNLGPGHETVMAVIQLLRQRVMATKCNMDPTLRDVRTLSFSAAFLSLDHVEDIPTTPQEQAIHTLFLALHVFLCATMKQDHRWTGTISRTMSRRLRDCLGFAPMFSTAWECHLPELLWVLFVGAVASEEFASGQGSWFVSHIEIVREIMKCDTRAEFEGYLSYVVWDEKFGNKLLEDWWANANDVDEIPLTPAIINMPPM